MLELSILPIDTIIDYSSKTFIFLAGLAALIFVHELGHFLAARRCGVVVEKFSLGFGPKIVSKTSGGTEFLICAIPLGGYVKMKGEELDEESPEEGSFSAAPVSSRMIIAFAGPLFNILFSILIYYFVYLGGVPVLSTQIGSVRDSSPAQAAGLATGDRIVEIDGQPVLYWEDLLKTVHKSPGKELNIVIERNAAKVMNLAITPLAEEITNMFGEKESVGLIGVTPLVQEIAYLKKDAPAEKAGFQLGDVIVSINGAPMQGWETLKENAADHPGKEAIFGVDRGGDRLSIAVTPKSEIVKDREGKKVEIGTLGMGLIGEMLTEQYGPFGAVKRAFKETWRVTYLIGASIKKMILGSVPADSIGGPILIFQIYGQQAEQGFLELILLTALLSINLGLLNLLPIPMLDGGHLFFFSIEALKGRPVSEKNRERAHQVGLFMLLSLMAFAFYNDIARIIN